MDDPRVRRGLEFGHDEVLDEAERRLDFYQQSLKHDLTIDDVRRYLLEHHGDVIPQSLFP